MASSDFAPSPGFFGIFFGVTLSVLAGAVLAAVHLAAKPVEVVTVEPQEREPGVVYFVSGVKGGDWERQVDGLARAGMTVRFSEGELNGWAERVFADYLKGQSAGRTELEAREMARSLNLRIVGNQLQVGVVWDHPGGVKGEKSAVQFRGGFAKSAFGWGYRPTEGYAGALPLHKIPGALTLARAYFPRWMPDLVSAESIEVGGGVLAVRMP